MKKITNLTGQAIQLTARKLKLNAEGELIEKTVQVDEETTRTEPEFEEALILGAKESIEMETVSEEIAAIPNLLIEDIQEEGNN